MSAPDVQRTPAAETSTASDAALWLDVFAQRRALGEYRLAVARMLLDLVREYRELAVQDFRDAARAAKQYAAAIDAERPVDDMDRLTPQILAALEGRDEQETSA